MYVCSYIATYIYITYVQVYTKLKYKVHHWNSDVAMGID